MISPFKYFEKRAKDGLLDPNGSLSSRVPSDKGVGQKRDIRGLVHVEYLSAEWAASEGKKRDPYNR